MSNNTPEMEDAEFYARLQIVLNNLMPGIGKLAQVDFGNLNEVCLEQQRRAHAAGVTYDAKIMYYPEQATKSRKRS